MEGKVVTGDPAIVMGVQATTLMAAAQATDSMEITPETIQKEGAQEAMDFYPQALQSLADIQRLHKCTDIRMLSKEEKIKFFNKKPTFFLGRNAKQPDHQALRKSSTHS